MRQFTVCAGLCGVGRLHEAVHSVCWAVWCGQAARGSSLCVLGCVVWAGCTRQFTLCVVWCEQAARGSSLCALGCVVWAGCMRQFTLCAGLCGVGRLHEAVHSVCWAVWCGQAA